MTDDMMDERLRAAGQRWRAANTTVAEVPADAGDEIDILAPPKKHRQRWITVASAAVLAAALVAGGIVFAANRNGSGHGHTAAPNEASRLTGKVWTLAEAPGSTLRIDSDGKVTGNDGCNAFGGTATVDEGTVFLKVGGTLMYCPGSSIEKTDRILSGAVVWSVSGDTLTLTKSGVGSLTYRSDAQQALPVLVGIDWQLTKIVDREGNTPTVGGHPTLNITSELHLSGSDGCNSVVGEVELRSGTINFGQVGTTEIACADSTVTSTASFVDAMLSGTVGYSISDGELTLTKTGVGSLTYRATKAELPITDPAQLTGSPWTLTSTEESDSTSGSGSSAVGVSVVTFDRHGTFTVRHRCYTNKGDAQLGTGTARFTNVALKLAIPCASNAETTEGQHENDRVDSVLTGNVTWSLTGRELTVTKGGSVLRFTKS